MKENHLIPKTKLGVEMYRVTPPPIFKIFTWDNWRYIGDIAIVGPLRGLELRLIVHSLSLTWPIS